ncbi:hypothetical protein CPAR01_07897 [Colletotrichum paranaense]|uniref:Uncharacterized protein n=1 Tax=Colletotrichum paranaense TaxID=1914294 RepID=A0ABQ9SIQ7_9PEZI|nr:uncharacterized protein CPAR01_07897 [Colletotrichum paranaense]KAK1537784.1 hypothetical protein CPAR01_07897 [Colletotrichum paranaense]
MAVFFLGSTKIPQSHSTSASRHFRKRSPSEQSLDKIPPDQQPLPEKPELRQRPSLKFIHVRSLGSPSSSRPSSPDRPASPRPPSSLSQPSRPSSPRPSSPRPSTPRPSTPPLLPPPRPRSTTTATMSSPTKNSVPPTSTTTSNPSTTTTSSSNPLNSSTSNSSYPNNSLSTSNPNSSLNNTNNTKSINNNTNNQNSGFGNSLPMPGLSGPANGPIGNLLKGPVDDNGKLKDAGLMVGIKLDLEAEVHLTARVRGDILVGLY